MSEKALQIAEEGRAVKSKGERERYTQLNGEFQRIAKTEKAFFKKQCKEIEENNKRGKTRDLFKKIWSYQGNISCKHGHDTCRNSKDLPEAEEI